MKSLGSLCITVLVLFAGVTSGIAAPAHSASAPPAANSTLATDIRPEASIVDTAPVNEQPNQTNVLRIPAAELEATRIERVSLSVGHAIANDDAGLRVDFAIKRFEGRFDQAETAEARRAIIQEAVTDLDTRVTTIHQRATSARERFNNGGDGRAYLWTLGQLHAQANALDRYAVLLRGQASDVPNTSVRTEIEVLRESLERFNGPVRSHVAEVVTGEASTARVYIATSRDSVVLATVTDDTYVREAYRGGARQDTGAPSVTTINEASNRIKDAYPWAWANQRSLTASSMFVAGKYEYQLVTPQGALQLSLDSRTGDVYRERQEQPLSTQYLESAGVTDDGIRITINRTYGSGPIRIRALDSQTGNPINGAVILDGEVVGSTGTDGTLWTVAPYRLNTVQIVSFGEGGTISASLSV